MKYAHKGDCDIVTNADGYTNRKALIHCDGDVLFSFPLDTDDMCIWLALDFANQAYRRGVDVGKYSAQRKIQAALGIGQY